MLGNLQILSQGGGGGIIFEHPLAGHFQTKLGQIVADIEDINCNFLY